MNVVNLGRRKTMELKGRVFLMQRSQQVLIPFDTEVGMQSTLHQNAGAAERNRFINLCADFFERADVGVRRTRPAVESTESANYVADVRVVNIAVDYVSDDVVRMSSLPDFVGGDADPGHIMRFEERGAIVYGEPGARDGFIQDALNLTRHVLSLLPGYPISKMKLLPMAL